ncbi:helix-turn-helix domain-containing protein [Methylobacterium planeticum]|uniref:Helix-turn-helix domain-containing protein n=1 Tax=Methylobacterium planeticum TaxID=2615211 RepID=A0A6N6N019_9HYPH|nr:helix-turn-helix domain-containing protein [Methylobacterium planeticum]KAB1076270.1 helix-turn-helix domain-containing protein [Methylobacterium planeticum]
MIAPFFDIRVDPAAPFPTDIGLRCYHLDRMLLGAVKASAQTVERTRTRIAAQAVDHVLLHLSLSGETCLETRSGEVPIRPRSFVVFDLTQEARFASKGLTGINLCIPRRAFDARVGEIANLHAARLPARETPLLKLLAAHLRTMRHCLENADPMRLDHVVSATLALCNAALTAPTDGAHDRETVLGVAVRQFIEENLAREDLGLEMLTARFGLSRTPLYALFEAEGGVIRYIRGRRLARAMRVLSGLEGGPRPRISTLAYACGFDCEKIFSRAFRRRYGVNPRDVDATFRREVHDEQAALLLSWMRDL